MIRHGINTFKEDTGSVAVTTAAVGIPFFIGAAPCHTAKGFTGKPQLINNFSEFKEQLGYSTEWRNEDETPKWNLCQAAYGFFMLSGMSPAIFYNIFDPAKHKKEVSPSEYPVEDHIVTLPIGAIKNDKITVKSDGIEDALVQGTDYEVYYLDDKLKIELLEDGQAYNKASLMIAYETSDVAAITAEDVEMAVEKVEECRGTIGIVPDLLCAPGWSQNPTIAAVMAAKAPNIGGLFRGKAVVDLDCSSSGAAVYSDVLKQKNDNGYTSEDMIVCWPMCKNGDYVFDLSVMVCGLIAKVDSGNGDCPYESPSNKTLPITATIDADGNEITITGPQSDIISVTDGVVTAVNNGGWNLWGNYTGIFPKSTDVAKKFICTNRMMDWLCNTFVTTYWQYIDKPLTPALRDAIINSYNVWLDSLKASGKLLGGQIEYISEMNPVTQLLAGKFVLNGEVAAPVPTENIEFHIAYSAEMLENAMG